MRVVQLRHSGIYKSTHSSKYNPGSPLCRLPKLWASLILLPSWKACINICLLNSRLSKAFNMILHKFKVSKWFVEWDLKSQCWQLHSILRDKHNGHPNRDGPLTLLWSPRWWKRIVNQQVLKWVILKSS